jgi:hypothetical protein
VDTLGKGGTKTAFAIPVSIQPFLEARVPALGEVPKVQAGQTDGVSRKRRTKSTSCSHNDSRSSRSGPWSVEWLHKIQQGDVGLISSKKKRMKRVVNDNKGYGGGNMHQASKKRAGGMLRRPVLTLKKVARLPSKDREEVMKVLKNSKIMKVLK